MNKNYITLLLLLTFITSGYAQGISQVYEKVNPAVVVVYTEENTIINSSDEPPKMMSSISQLGSGVMITDNEIITAANLIELSDTVRVEFLDGSVISAKVIGLSKSADIALIKLDYPKPEAVTVAMGNSDELHHGQPVFIVVAPDNLEHSVSVGAVKKVIKNKPTRQVNSIDYIQTTAPIESSYVGGPMFNMKGEVVGIVGELMEETEEFPSIPYVITSNAIQDLLFEKTIEWNGIHARPLTGDLARRYELPQTSGLLVEHIESHSPLGMMGLRKEDIILSFTDIKFEMKDETLDRMGNISYELQPNESFEMMVYRGEKVVFLNRN